MLVMVLLDLLRLLLLLNSGRGLRQRDVRNRQRTLKRASAVQLLTTYSTPLRHGPRHSISWLCFLTARIRLLLTPPVGSDRNAGARNG